MYKWNGHPQENEQVFQACGTRKFNKMKGCSASLQGGGMGEKGKAICSNDYTGNKIPVFIVIN